MAQRKNSGRTAPRIGFRENRNASATKGGPGRFHKAGDTGHRLTKPRKLRASDALLAAWAAKRLPKWEGERDAAGAYTMVGGSIDRETGEYIRRKWLAGISAQRGF
jgi:hypothetical protein